MTPSGRGHAAQRISPTGLAIVIALHGAALFALLRMNAIRLPAELPVLTVDLLKPPAPDLPGPAIAPPKPRPVEQRPVPRPVQEPAPLAPPAEAPAAAPAIDIPAVPPAPTFARSVPPAPPAPPVAASKPRFDADYLDNPTPAYPPLSRRMREEGRVVLRVQVAANGLPTEVALHAGSGSDRLDRAALETVRRWKFMPARIGDEAVAASVLVPIVFSLKD
ncbi:MAG: TonB family protein [Rhodocyclaceae bacterium]|jgi:protein TonB|nr:TonB family protein [Rhodocyclaceae bacterium]